MKNVVFFTTIFIIICFTLLNAQEKKMTLSLNGAVSMMSYNYIDEQGKQQTENVAVLRASPYMSIPPVSLGLDVNWILADKETREKFTEKDTGKNPVIVRFVEYDKEPVFARWGLLESITLGNGFIMNNYTTASTAQSAAYTNKDKGTILSYEKPEYGFTALGTYRHLYGGRGYYEIIDKLTIGVTYIHDREAPGYERFTVYGIDAKYSLFKNVSLYADYAKIDEAGDGYAVGLNFVPTSRISWQNEYRTLDKDFIPSIYDAHYEANKLTTDNILAISRREDKNGFYSKLRLDLAEQLKAYIAYEDYDKVSPRLIGEAQFKFETPKAKEGLIGFGGKVEGKIIYEQKNFRPTDVKKKDEVITGEIKSPINPYTNLVVHYKKVYDEGGNPVETYRYEIELKF